MRYWDRSATLAIGSKIYSMDDLSFSFDVTVEDKAKLCVADVEVYNLSPAVRNAIKKNDMLIINAGYDGDVGALFVGKIAKCTHTIGDTDIVTKITAAEALGKWITKKVNKTYSPGTRASEIILDLLRIFGLELSVFKLVVDKSYPRGRVCKGKVKDVLKKIVTKECKSRFLIKRGRIVINDPDDAVSIGYALTKDTGLIRVGETIEQVTAKKDKKKALVKKQTCLLNYHLGVGDKIMIESETLSGKFKIISIHHVGSRSGVWNTELEVKQA